MSAVSPQPSTGLARRFVTPEGVDLRLVLGSAGQRLSAFILDCLILLAVAIVFSLLCLFLGLATRQASLFIVWTLGFFVLRNGYFMFWELRPRSATPGKRVTGVRVAARDGGRLRADSVFARNAMREVELFLPLTFLGMSFAQGAWLVGLAGIGWSVGLLLLPLFNRDRLRAGDLIAGTWVVRQPKRGLLRDMTEGGEVLAARFRFTSAQLDAYGEMELHVLEEVVRQRQPATVKDVAARIRRKIGWQASAQESDLEFLDAFYAAQRRMLERGLLFGARRKDKHDRR